MLSPLACHEINEQRIHTCLSVCLEIISRKPARHNIDKNLSIGSECNPVTYARDRICKLPSGDELWCTPAHVHAYDPIGTQIFCGYIDLVH